MSWDWHVLGTSSCSECAPLCVSLCLWSRDFRGNAGINCTNWVRMTPRLIKSRVGDHKTMSEHSSCTQGSFCYVSLCCQREGVQPIVGGPPPGKKRAEIPTRSSLLCGWGQSAKFRSCQSPFGSATIVASCDMVAEVDSASCQLPTGARKRKPQTVSRMLSAAMVTLSSFCLASVGPARCVQISG